MKKYLLTLLAACGTLFATAQTDQMTVTLNDGTSKTYNVADIASVSFGEAAEHTLVGSAKATVADAATGVNVETTIEYYSDGTYTVKNYQGYEGYDLSFTANEDGSVKIIGANDTYAAPYSTVVINDNGDVEYMYANVANWSSVEGDQYKGEMWIFCYDTTKTSGNYLDITWDSWESVYQQAAYRTYDSATQTYTTICRGDVCRSTIDGSLKFGNFLNSGIELIAAVDKNYAKDSGYGDGTYSYLLDFSNNESIYALDDPYNGVSQIEYWLYNSADESYNSWTFDENTTINKFYLYGRYGDTPYTVINPYQGTSSMRLSVTFTCCWSQNDETAMDWHYVYMDFPGELAK